MWTDLQQQADGCAAFSEPILGVQQGLFLACYRRLPSGRMASFETKRGPPGGDVDLGRAGGAQSVPALMQPDSSSAPRPLHMPPPHLMLLLDGGGASNGLRESSVAAAKENDDLSAARKRPRMETSFSSRISSGSSPSLSRGDSARLLRHAQQ